jgi:hypothetical protein
LSNSNRTGGGDPCRGLVMQLDECKLRYACDQHNHVELTFDHADFSDADRQIAALIGFQLSLGGDLAHDIWQPREAVALKPLMQR